MWPRLTIKKWIKKYNLMVHFKHSSKSQFWGQLSAENYNLQDGTAERNPNQRCLRTKITNKRKVLLFISSSFFHFFPFLGVLTASSNQIPQSLSKRQCENAKRVPKTRTRNTLYSETESVIN